MLLFLALSATVSLNGISDITKFLGMDNPQIIKTSPIRSNISLIVLPRPGRKVSTHASYDYIFENIFGYLKKRKENYPVTLIYCVGINWVGYGYEVEYIQSIFKPSYLIMLFFSQYDL